jgi:hypothetical protein
MTMKRTLICGILLGFLTATAANAAVSVNLVASGTFLPGSVITLETRVTANAGEIDNTVFGAILYPGAQVDGPLDPGPGGTQSQNVLPGAGWIAGSLSCNTSRCLAFNQINSTLPQPDPVNVTNFLIATNTFTIQANQTPGTVITFGWQTTPSTQRVDWFGLTTAPGVSVTVAVPEPTTVAMLGLGLVGLAMAGRRRS